MRTAKAIPSNGKYRFPYDQLVVQSHVHFGPIASGDIVVASSALVESLLGIDPQLIGIEMEAAGVAAAITHSNTVADLIEIRGVADLADEHKADTWVDKACYAAAYFAKDLLCHLPV